MMVTYDKLYKVSICLFLFSSYSLKTAAAPYHNQQNQYLQNSADYGNDLQMQINAIRHNQKNHEHELRVFDEKFETFQSIVESLRRQFQDSFKLHSDNFKASALIFESKFNDLETAAKGAAADLRQLRDHANQSSTVLAQYQLRLLEMEKETERQTQQIATLQNALQSIAELFAKENSDLPSPPPTTSKVYQVKSGDSLEKIASANDTTVKVLKELNNLTSDRIFINQKLKLPER